MMCMVYLRLQVVPCRQLFMETYNSVKAKHSGAAELGEEPAAVAA